MRRLCLLLLFLSLTGLTFYGVSDAPQRLYALAQPLQGWRWPTGHPIRLPLTLDSGERAYALPADIVQHYRHFPAWLKDYHGVVVQAGAVGLLLTGLIATLWPSHWPPVPDNPALRHVRGPQLITRRPAGRFVQALHRWLWLGAALSLAAWLGQNGPWSNGDLHPFRAPRLWGGFQHAFTRADWRAGALLALAVGYGVAAGVMVWRGWRWPGARPPTRRDRLTLGGVPLAREGETRHYLIGGRTGGGKTQAIQELLRPLRQGRERAIIADPGGGYLARFYRAGDLLLNLFDRRSMAWSPFAEIEQPYDCDRLAKAAIPDAASPVNQEWHFYAQTLLAALLKALAAAEQRAVSTLLRLVAVAPAEELSAWLAGSPAAILTLPGNAKMLSNTRAIIATYLSGWQYLPDTGAFSVRQWVRTEGASRWLYLTYQDDQKALSRHLIATWLDLAVVEGLSLTEDPARRLWYVLDELDSLGKVTTLKDGLTQLRKRGGAVIAGLQTIAQLRTTYGRDEAQTLLSSLLNKLVLGVGDGETAGYFQTEIGQRDVKREEISATHGASGGRGTRQRHQGWRQQTEWLVLASELQGLPDRQGYLRPAGERNWHRVLIPLVAMPQVARPFEPAADSLPRFAKTAPMDRELGSAPSGPSPAPARPDAPPSPARHPAPADSPGATPPPRAVPRSWRRRPALAPGPAPHQALTPSPAAAPGREPEPESDE